LHRLAIGELVPELTICIELDLDTSLRRAYRRNSTSDGGNAEARFDEQSIGFHECVRDGYHRIAHEEPERFRLVDGSGEEAEVAIRVWSLVEPRLVEKGFVGGKT
jgi:dTMP kinase